MSLGYAYKWYEKKHVLTKMENKIFRARFWPSNFNNSRGAYSNLYSIHGFSKLLEEINTNKISFFPQTIKKGFLLQRYVCIYLSLILSYNYIIYYLIRMLQSIINNLFQDIYSIVEFRLQASPHGRSASIVTCLLDT